MLMSKNANNDVSKDSRIVLNRTKTCQLMQMKCSRMLKCHWEETSLDEKELLGPKRLDLGVTVQQRDLKVIIVEMPALWHAKQSFLGVSFLIIT